MSESIEARLERLEKNDKAIRKALRELLYDAKERENASDPEHVTKRGGMWRDIYHTIPDPDVSSEELFPEPSFAPAGTIPATLRRVSDDAPAKRWWVCDKHGDVYVWESEGQARKIVICWERDFPHHAPHLVVEAATEAEAIAEYRRRMMACGYTREDGDKCIHGVRCGIAGEELPPELCEGPVTAFDNTDKKVLIMREIDNLINSSDRIASRVGLELSLIVYTLSPEKVEEIKEPILNIIEVVDPTTDYHKFKKGPK